MTIPARDGDRCPECGTPLEPIELSGSPAEAVDEFVLRCANGHERRVVRHDAADDVDDAADESGDGTGDGRGGGTGSTRATR